MESHESKLLIKIGKNFEANATGNVAIGVVFVIVVAFLAIGYSFV